jgi:hypothetical protein
MNIAEEDLSDALTGRGGLLAFLAEKLNWPLTPQHTDGFLYQEAEDLTERVPATAEVFRLLPVTAADAIPVFLVEFVQGFSRPALREILTDIHRTVCERGERNTEEAVFVCAAVGVLLPAPQTDDEDAAQGLLLALSGPGSVRLAYTAVCFAQYAKPNGEPARLRSLAFHSDDIADTHALRIAHLPALTMALNALGEPDWAHCRKTWAAAWDDEALARAFHRDYQRIFNEVRDYYLRDVHEDRTLFAQRLFHRLFFLHFLSKKGWMKFQGREDYLFALRDAAEEADENFYRDRLHWAFFQGLGMLKAPQLYSVEECIEKRGEVPCTNISLFEIADRDDIHRAVWIENEAFDIILDRLLGRYQFSCFESSPDDIEVAIDLETFGKVLEKQVTGRLESVPYHTPGPFITFLCREAIKAHLAERITPTPSAPRFNPSPARTPLAAPGRTCSVCSAN